MTKTEVEIEHMLWTVSYSPEAGAWFSLRPVEHDKQLFSGPIHEGMADELRELARAVAKIEKEIVERCESCDGSGWIEVVRMVRVSGEYQAYEPVAENERCDECNPLGV